jgi:transcriptional regulator with XRE-family HTH domain
VSGLREARRQRGWTQLQVIVALQEAARRRRIAIPDDRESVRVRVSSWENGRSSPAEPYLGLLAEVLGVPAVALVADVPVAGVESEQLAAAARESLVFATWADQGRESSVAMDHVTSELARIAISYVHCPPGPLFADLVKLRDITFGMLRDHPRPRRARDLFFLSGVTCAMLAHATEELGDSSSAVAQVRTAWTCAEEADHDALRGWVLGTAALIAEWTGRPEEAVRLATQGQAFIQPAGARARLMAIEARARARVGDAAGAVRALEQGLRDSENEARGGSDDVESFGGILTFPEAKLRYYGGSTLSLAGEHERAEAMALEAIGMYEASPPAERSYGDEALARVDVVTSRLVRGDFDGCQNMIRPVLALPASQRIEQLTIGLGQVAAQLGGDRFAGARAAQELIGEIQAFNAARALPVGHQ